jgi:YfiH family protein
VSAQGWLVSPVLARAGAEHGFGTRAAAPPAGLCRPVQVHGRRVVQLTDVRAPLGEADAVVSAAGGVPVAVATADCVPVLIAAPSARVVAAVHAGWRGLAAGVIEAALAALARRGVAPADVAAAIGPHIGPCCYEVDEPVLRALRARFVGRLESSMRPGRAEHAWIDLGGLARDALAAAGVPAAQVDASAAACTRCDAARFHSFRRDGARAGRLLHWIAATRRPGNP